MQCVSHPECVQLFQRYNLESIHNSTFGGVVILRVCLVISKIQSGINSQPNKPKTEFKLECVQLFQRYNLESIHNQTETAYTVSTVCLVISKIQSGINSQPVWSGLFMDLKCVQLFQRYNLESIHNCQRKPYLRARSVFSYFKDTIWNQFTTYKRYIQY